KCPSCSHLINSSFVRAGAVVVCPACQHRYRITQSHFTRYIATPVPLLPNESNLLLTREGENGLTTPGLHLDDSGLVIGLSGLREAMRQDPERLGTQDQPQHSVPKADPTETRRNLTLSDPHRRARRAAFLL